MNSCWHAKLPLLAVGSYSEDKGGYVTVYTGSKLGSSLCRAWEFSCNLEEIDKGNFLEYLLLAVIPRNRPDPGTFLSPKTSAKKTGQKRKHTNIDFKNLTN